jgi:cytochrome c peroxidase
MKNKLTVIAVLLSGTVLLSFLSSPELSPPEKIKEYYITRLQSLSQKLEDLKIAVELNKNEKIIHEHFLQARLAYKQLELFIEYYAELDVAKFNGLATHFIEEEDPTAYQEPQGFQMIETFIYPHYNNAKKIELQDYVSRLLMLTNGFLNNHGNFKPNEYILDATMEELYRILSLGISGFDSPIAQLSLPEAKASLNSVQFIIETYKNEITAAQINNCAAILQLLNEAKSYLDTHNQFNRFNRMEFITRFLNPVTAWLGDLKTKTGYKDNPSRYTLIKKTSHLFEKSSLVVNRYINDDTSTTERIVLGKKLFYEAALSFNGKRSCASCHQPGKAFTDGLPKAMQLDEHGVLPRNTPTLWNAALQKNLFYDSRQNFLDDLIIEVLHNEKEMNSGKAGAAKKLQTDLVYRELFFRAYPSADNSVTDKKIANAISMYVRTLISYNSRFDLYMRGQKDKMNAEEIKGFNLFMGKAKCATCHYVPLFNGSKPPTYYYQESEVLGVPSNADPLHPIPDADEGRGKVLKVDFMNRAFKTPTLRNIALTGPYMHNGVYKTLEEVIDFYDRGGGKGLGLANPNQTLPEDKLHLTKIEKKQLISFLKTLTDTKAANN